MDIAHALFTSTAIALAALFAGFAFHALLVAAVRLAHAHTPLRIAGVRLHLEPIFGPLRALIPALALAAALPFMPVPAGIRLAVDHAIVLWTIGSLAWLLIRLLAIARDLIVTQQQLQAPDNVHARSLYTQLVVMQRISAAVIVIFAASAMLMTFSEAHQLGIGLLESAGVVGIVVGFAAQRSLGTLLAGMQLAWNQPIRVDDVVVVEGEWGRIEEITLAYVIIRIWDDRRLVVPATYFIEKPFQNWTRTTAPLLGTVYAYADYTLPVPPVREALHQILTHTPLWDGRTWGLQVTNATERTLELRALVSAANSSDLWDLRCLVREQLIALLERRYPDHLPQTRIELGRPQDAKDARPTPLHPSGRRQTGDPSSSDTGSHGP